MRFLNPLLAAVALTVSQPALANEDGSRLIVHQQGAGQLDESGWTDARSDGGAFSGRFPCVYDDYSQTDPAQPELLLHWLNCLRSDNVRFAIMRSTGLEAKQARAMFDGFANDPKFRPLTFKGKSAYSYATIADGRCARSLVVWTGQDSLSAVVERMGGDANCLTVLSDANTFMNALEVEPR
jgi:hypothetical protein